MPPDNARTKRAIKRESVTNPKLSGLVQTVLGPVRPEHLGTTLTHEHLLIDLAWMAEPAVEASERLKMSQPVTMEELGWVRYNSQRNRDDRELLDEETAISEALLFKRWGGKTIVDATTIGIGRDPRALARIARATDLNIVMGTGFYVDAVHPEDMDERTEAEVARQMVEEVTVGVDDTGVRAGIIGELGCSWPLTKNENKVLRAGATAQRETGAPILVHPGRDEAAPFEILDVLAAAGADLRRVIMGHIDRTVLDMGMIVDLARRGCYLEFDIFGRESSYYPLSDVDMPNDAQRIGFIKGLIEAGHTSQIVIAQDICTKDRLVKYGGHGYHHILENIVPRMREAGISQGDIDAILVANPARILSFV